MSDDLRAWLMPAETVPYVLATMRERDSYMKVDSVIGIGGNNCMVLFRGSYPFLENAMKEERPCIQLDDLKWPESLYKKKEDNE